MAYDVECFSNLETGQTATLDAPLTMELITQAAIRSTRNIRHVPAVCCGIGNNSLKLAHYVPPFDCDLDDLEQAHAAKSSRFAAFGAIKAK